MKGVLIMSHPIEGIMGVSMENIHQMVDVNTIIGDPIVKGDTTIIPISKVSFGFASGGSDLPTQAAEKFAGGAGAGVTVKPVAFIVIKADGDVKLLELGGKASPIEGVMDSLPGIIDKIKNAVADKKAEKAANPDPKQVEKAEAKLEKAEAKLEKMEAKAEKTSVRDEARIAKAAAKVEAARAEAQAQIAAENNVKKDKE
ncbi:MAG: GerW family sporulation protein [Oscillospiraceae bacterium]|nr:GerW family sporulation protein [Oscillospiraceae bacterium]